MDFFGGAGDNNEIKSKDNMNELIKNLGENEKGKKEKNIKI